MQNEFLTIFIDGTKYVAIKRETMARSNYNYMIEVYKNDERLPIAGTTCKISDTVWDYMEYIVTTIKNNVFDVDPLYESLKNL